MTIDNFNLIKKTLVFNSQDDFYFLQILKRKKENPDIGSNAQTIAVYYVTSVEYLDSKEAEIKTLCELHNARAYFNLNRRSFEQMAFNTLKKISDQILNRDYRSIKTAYTSVAGALNNEPKKSKKWIVDVDTKDTEELKQIQEIINRCRPSDEPKIVMSVPTKNGVHIITTPFDVKQFEETARDYLALGRISEIPDLQKNNPTLLYY